jgi:Na+-driven multidrug efflux pump
MFLIALFSIFIKSPTLLVGLLTGAAWGIVLGTTVNALILYRRLKRTNSQELKSLAKMDSTQAHRSLTAVNTSRIVEVESVTEETTALLKIGRDTERDR